MMLPLLALFVVTVVGISSGNTTHCDAQAPTLGCLNWGLKQDPVDGRRYSINRLNCTTSGRIMPWTAAPIRSDFFTVRSGNEGPVASDVAFYHPGEYMTIFVRATTYQKRYRGLLMYAVDSSSRVVGNFEFAPETEAVPFWTPPVWKGLCAPAGLGNGLLHKNADEKPYTIGFRWKAPAAGTGSVTFKALFKAGAANEGDFHFPSNEGRGDLILSERNAAIEGAVPPLIWFQAASAADTCASVCAAQGRSGVDTTLMTDTNDGGDGMSTYHPSAADAYYRSTLCRFPFVSSCAADSPAIDTASKYCYYKSASCPAWRNLTIPTSRRRMCACLTAANPVQPCAADQNWPSTAAGATAMLACPQGQVGNNTRVCSATGVWGTAVSTCVATANCSDGVQNQGEYGIDCGGPCAACLNCPTINCGAHGTCVEGVNATCNCNSSYTGTRCEIAPVNPCDTWVCANGGTCQVENSLPKCLCVAPNIGIHCDMLAAPTCMDGRMNQNETGVDCGGPCAACDTFFWEVGVWGACDRPCGGGLRTRGQTCKNSTGQVRPSADCSAIHLPITQETCNPDPCPTYTWVAGNWEACSTVCGGGNRIRPVNCWSSVGPSIVTVAGLCAETLKPTSTETCNTATCPGARWVSDPWGACSLPCGGGVQTRVNRCKNTQNQEVDTSLCSGAAPPASQQACNIFGCLAYDWYMCPNWGPCTATCGGGDGMLGQQYRGLFCKASDGKQVDYSLCDPTSKPINVLSVCNTWPCSDFNWMADGDWSACNGTHRNRGFHCHARDGAVALRTQCAHVPLPVAAIPCSPGLVECSEAGYSPTPFAVSASPKMQTSVSLALAALSSMVSSPRLGLLSMGLLALSFVVPTEAHNWMHTPGRASLQASTIAPCQARKDSDLHAQVARDQRFTMRFATGHERDSYFVTVMGTNEEWLAADNFETMVDDYIAKAPAEDHLSQYNRRFHGYLGGNADKYSNTASNPGMMFNGVVSPGEADYPGHTRVNATTIYRYTDAALANDKRASYVSTLYPWIISAARLPHIYPLPDDFDAFHWTIPSQSNVQDGHVIVHWRWSGYYDCIDVDLRPSSEGNVQYPDGILNASAHVWSQIDHCQYEKPAAIMTRCMEVIDSVKPCITALPQGDWNAHVRLGLNVVPFRNPSSVNPDFAHYVAIPWNKRECSSSWNQLPGTVAETPLNWDAWLAKTNLLTGQDCGSSSHDFREYDLKRAVGLCVGIPTCTGISWEVKAGTLIQNGLQRFKLCTGTGNAPNVAFNLYRPKALSTATYSSGTVKMINFAQGPMFNYTTPAADMVTDSGYMYGSRNGQTYGWNCKADLTCAWCCDAYVCLNSPQCCSGNPDFTYIYDIHAECPDNIDVRKHFEFDLPNGVYQITTRHQGWDNNDVDVGGCNVENTGVVQMRNQQTPVASQFTFKVEVTDGKLTFNGDSAIPNTNCRFINWIKYELKGPVGTWDEIWMPPATSNPVWEQNAGTPVPIGLVTLKNYETYSQNDAPICSAWWLFKGAACYPSKAANWFNNTGSEGAIVGVSNVSCVTGNCAGFVECGKVQVPRAYYENEYYVDCNGKVGQYVFVKMPGSARYLTVQVSAYLAAPLVPANDNPLVCYGLEARPSAATRPEYIISLDPEDPIFYSTCYVRNPNVIWLPTGPQVSTVDRWRFNGRCLSCEAFQRNHIKSFASLPAPWMMTDGKCIDCDVEPVPLTPPAINWVAAYMSECDNPATETTNRGLPSCTGAPFTSCHKRLYARGRVAEIDQYGSTTLTEVECQAVAARDPECGTSIQYRRASWGTVCECQRIHPCCGRCTPNSASYGEVRTTNPENNYVIYDRSVSLIPDQFCSSGLKSTDGTLCCTNDCKDSTGANVCGASPSTCKTAVGGGICCKGDQMTLFAQSCTVTGPPCKLT